METENNVASPFNGSGGGLTGGGYGGVISYSFGPERWKFCPECGNRLDTTWKFCAQCGKEIGCSWYGYVPMGPTVSPTIAPFTSPNYCTSSVTFHPSS